MALQQDLNRATRGAETSKREADRSLQQLKSNLQELSSTASNVVSNHRTLSSSEPGSRYEDTAFERLERELKKLRTMFDRADKEINGYTQKAQELLNHKRQVAELKKQIQRQNTAAKA